MTHSGRVLPECEFLALEFVVQAKTKIAPQRLLSQEERIANFTSRLDASARYILLLPAILIVLVLAVFPLLVSLYLSFSRFKFIKGGFAIDFVGFANYAKLLSGSEQRTFLGKTAPLPLLGWALLAVLVGVMLYMLYRYFRSPRFTIFGCIMRIISIVLTTVLAWLMLTTLVGEGGLPGALVVTLLFVLVGLALQYVLGLGLALLLTQNLPGKRLFRVIFLMPMMITPVGIGFLFKMMTDALKGPFSPLLLALGLGNTSLLGSGDTARMAVLIGDIWQWTPFVFIILLAGLEGVSRETIEASLVDGANRWQLFRNIIFPEIVPVSTTVVLIRLIEAFKIIDLPNILTGGGPGTATTTMTLQAYTDFRTLDLGGSSAIAYLLLIVVTFCAMVFVNFIRRQVLEAVG
jgi:multiple sugar transport system permease protein